jgi:hypothetical protein
MSWLINSMKVKLQNQFMMLDTALQMWDRAAEMYSQGESWTSLSPSDQVRSSNTRRNECD